VHGVSCLTLDALDDLAPLTPPAAGGHHYTAQEARRLLTEAIATS
jgi:hypothetical protein